MDVHCAAIHFKHDGIEQGTHITYTGMGNILFTQGKSLNKRWPAGVPGSPVHVGEPHSQKFGLS